MRFTLTALVLMMLVIGAFLFTRTDLGKISPRAEPQPLSGVVTAKEWVPARDDMTFIPIYHGDGTSTQVPIFTHSPEEWRIYVGKRYVRVSKEEFQGTEIQSHFTERLGR